MIYEKYPETLESENLQCPYCKEFYGDSWEVIKSDDSIELECDCGKKFWASEIVIRDFKARADCKLNNEQHNFVDNYKESLKCNKCGELKFK